MITELRTREKELMKGRMTDADREARGKSPPRGSFEVGHPRHTLVQTLEA